MTLCDPDPGRSQERGCDVTAATLGTVDELTGVGDVRLLPGETSSSRTSGKTKKRCSEMRSAVFSRANGKEVD